MSTGTDECPYSRVAYREIERVERRLCDGVRFAFRHFPLSEIHPHALAAAAAAEAAAPHRFWEMHSLLFHRQSANSEIAALDALDQAGGTDRARDEDEK